MQLNEIMSTKDKILKAGQSQVQVSIRLIRGRGRTGEKLTLTFPPQDDSAAQARFRNLCGPVMEAPLKEAAKQNTEAQQLTEP